MGSTMGRNYPHPPTTHHPHQPWVWHGYRYSPPRPRYYIGTTTTPALRPVKPVDNSVENRKPVFGLGLVLESQFWGLSASVLGTYEALSYLSRKRVPTVSTFCARRLWRRSLLAAWTLGLGAHIVCHRLEESS